MVECKRGSVRVKRGKSGRKAHCRKKAAGKRKIARMGTKHRPYKTVGAAKKSMKYKNAKMGDKIKLYHISGNTKRLRRVLVKK